MLRVHFNSHIRTENANQRTSTSRIRRESSSEMTSSEIEEKNTGLCKSGKCKTIRFNASTKLLSSTDSLLEDQKTQAIDNLNSLSVRTPSDSARPLSTATCDRLLPSASITSLCSVFGVGVGVGDGGTGAAPINTVAFSSRRRASFVRAPSVNTLGRLTVDRPLYFDRARRLNDASVLLALAGFVLGVIVQEIVAASLFGTELRVLNEILSGLILRKITCKLRH